VGLHGEKLDLEFLHFSKLLNDVLVGPFQLLAFRSQIVILELVSLQFLGNTVKNLFAAESCKLYLLVGQAFLLHDLLDRLHCEAVGLNDDVSGELSGHDVCPLFGLGLHQLGVEVAVVT